MDCDLLLNWLTHKGEGSWSQFRRAVQELSPADSKMDQVCRRTRVFLSDLGYVDFFVNATQGWRMLAPGLGGLAMQPNSAVLWGGRTPTLINSLEADSNGCGCLMRRHEIMDAPAGIRIEGPQNNLSAIAKRNGLLYVENLGMSMCKMLEPISQKLDQASNEPEPINWKVQSFDLQSLKWVDGRLRRSACKYSPMYGRDKYFLHIRGGSLLHMNKREAVYASAMLNGIQLVVYDEENYSLSTPLEAPLPEALSRVACLCSGEPAEVSGRRWCYKEIPPKIAFVLMFTAGQPYPRFSDFVAIGGSSGG